jgi:hypothetical protein
MNNQTILQLAQLSQNEIQLQAQASDLDKKNRFNWLNPIPKFLTNQQSIKLLSNLPESITKNLLENPETQSYFHNDIRALKLYIETLPSTQILSKPEEEGYVDPVEFNQFFKDNYISTQAYKLNLRDLSEYELWLSQNQSISRKQSWAFYVSEQIELQEKQGLTNIQPNFSLQYFFADIQASEQAAYLKQILPKSKLNETPQMPSSKSNLDITNQFQSAKLDPQTFQSNADSFSLPSSGQNTKYTSHQRTISPKLNSSEVNDQTQNMNSDIGQSEFSLQQLLNIQNIQNITQADPDQENQSNQENPYLQEQKSSLPSKIPLQNNLQTPANINLVQPSPINRQKRLNYAKIVGYSSAGVLSAGTGALAIFNSIFG